MSELVFRYNVSADGVSVANGEQSGSGASMLKITETVAAQVEETPGTATIACVIDEDNLTGLLIHSDQDLSLTTKQDGGDVDNITLSANVPVIWTPDSVGAKPITDDLDQIVAVNTGATAATLTIVALTDPTPA